MNRKDERDAVRILKALLLSNRNRSLRIMKVHLQDDQQHVRIHLNEDFANGDIIISVTTEEDTQE